MLQHQVCSNNSPTENNPKENIRNVCLSLLLSPLDLLCLTSFRNNVQKSSNLSYFSPASNTQFLQIIFNHLCLDFSAYLLPSGTFLNTFLTFLSSGILSSCPNHRKLWLVRIFHMTFSFAETNIYLSVISFPVFLTYYRGFFWVSRLASHTFLPLYELLYVKQSVL